MSSPGQKNNPSVGEISLLLQWIPSVEKTVLLFGFPVLCGYIIIIMYEFHRYGPEK